MADLNIIFGISGLTHPSLLKNFYPDDLPEDWRLEYYSNEFDVLLCSESDIESLEELQKEIEEKIFICLLDRKAGQNQELPEKIIPLDQTSDLNLTDRDDGLQWVDAVTGQRGIGLCLINKLQKNTPQIIRQLIETIRRYASRQDYSEVCVIFNDDHALENCRSAIVIEAMM